MVRRSGSVKITHYNKFKKGSIKTFKRPAYPSFVLLHILFFMNKVRGEKVEPSEHWIKVFLFSALVCGSQQICHCGQRHKVHSSPAKPLKRERQEIFSSATRPTIIKVSIQMRLQEHDVLGRVNNVLVMGTGWFWVDSDLQSDTEHFLPLTVRADHSAAITETSSWTWGVSLWVSHWVSMKLRPTCSWGSGTALIFSTSSLCEDAAELYDVISMVLLDKKMEFWNLKASFLSF